MIRILKKIIHEYSIWLMKKQRLKQWLYLYAIIRDLSKVENHLENLNL